MNRPAPPRDERRPWSRSEILATGAAFAVLAAVYLRSLGGPSLWLDEAWEANYYAGFTAAPWYNRPILYMAAVRALVAAFGPSESVLRLLPCLAGLGAVAATYVLARSWMGRGRAALAAGLLAVAPAFLFAAHELKHYTLDALTTCVLLLAYERYRRSGTRRALAAWVAVAVVSFGVSFTGPFVLAAIAAIEIVRLRAEPRRLAPFVLAVAVASAAFAVIYATSYAGASDDTLLTGYFAADYAPLSDPLALPAWTATRTIEVLRGVTGLSSGVVLVLVLTAGLAATFRGPAWVLAAFVPAAAGVQLAASGLRLYPYGVVRLTLYLAPPVCMLLAAGIGTAFPRGRGSWPGRVVLAGLLYAVLHANLAEARPYLTTGWRSEHIRELVATVAREREAGEGLYVNEDAEPALRFYWSRAGHSLDGDDDVVWASRNAANPERHADEIDELARRFEVVWTLFSHIRPGELRELRAMLLERFERVESIVEGDARLERYRRKPRPGPAG